MAHAAEARLTDVRATDRKIGRPETASFADRLCVASIAPRLLHRSSPEPLLRPPIQRTLAHLLTAPLVNGWDCHSTQGSRGRQFTSVPFVVRYAQSSFYPRVHAQLVPSCSPSSQKAQGGDTYDAPAMVFVSWDGSPHRVL